jgi:cellulose synthase/poly-beta-1,6-N-acetylglucosamine synthase-like glycosyltransferase
LNFVKTNLATVIIPPYKDWEALDNILFGLSHQTEQAFEVIVSEDGDDPLIKDVCHQYSNLRLLHLSQKDSGYRKNLALNRAIERSTTDYLIFIDGDCVPHSSFVERHLSHAERGFVLAGRRMHLGPRYSQRLRKDRSLLFRLEDPFFRISNLIGLHADGVRNFECGGPSDFLHRVYRGHLLNLIGCNFSCWANDIVSVNGFDEDLPGCGGEDDDLQWRFEAFGLKMKNVKFQCIVYHLHHTPRRIYVEENNKIMRTNQAANRFRCGNGIVKD